MYRLIALLLLGIFPLMFTGCVGPMGAGCCGPMGASCSKTCSDGCNSCTGCGELYVGPWTNHPADCVDPCDSCGNYNGQSCGACRSIFAGYKSLWGYRCGCDPAPVALSDRCFAPGRASSCGIEPACGCEGVCDCIGEPTCGLEPTCGFEPGCGFEATCGCESGCQCGNNDMVYPDVIHAEPVMNEPAPVMNRPIVESVQPAYTPSRTRKIFRPRTANGRGFLNEHRR